jgi:hypothetical protein
MPIFHSQSRDELRQLYFHAWRKCREHLPMEPLEAQIADIIAEHPEYQPVLEKSADSLHQEFRPEDGTSNPFLHMGLHLAVRDQVATDRPPGIRAAFAALARTMASAHDVEHALIECLGEALWQAQRSGLPPDEHAYLERIQRLPLRGKR